MAISSSSARDGLTSQFVAVDRADEGAAAWSPDGTRIAYVERSPAHFSGRLLVLDVDRDRRARSRRAARTAALRRRPRRRLVDRPAGVVAGRLAARGGAAGIGLGPRLPLPVKDGPPRAITSGAFEDGSPVFSPDGRSLAIISNQGQSRRTARLDRADGRRRGAGSALDGAVVGVESARSGRRTAGAVLHPDHATRAAGLCSSRASSGGDRPARIIRSRALNFERAGSRRRPKSQFKSRDGLEITALLYTPPPSRSRRAGRRPYSGFTADRKARTRSASIPGRCSSRSRATSCSKPNYRGSSGYGERFRNLNVEDSGGGELEDVVAGAQCLDRHRASPIPPASRSAADRTAAPWSRTRSRSSRRCSRSAIELFGVVDRASYNERTNRNAAIRWMRKMGGTPLEKPEVYRQGQRPAGRAAGSPRRCW